MYWPGGPASGPCNVKSLHRGPKGPPPTYIYLDPVHNYPDKYLSAYTSYYTYFLYKQVYLAHSELFILITRVDHMPRFRGKLYYFSGGITYKEFILTSKNAESSQVSTVPKIIDMYVSIVFDCTHVLFFP